MRRPARKQTAQTRWNNSNLCTISCKLRVPQAEEFVDNCDDHGMTIYAAVQMFCKAVIKDPDILLYIKHELKG